MNRHRILYIQYTNPAGYPPLEHSSRILAKKGWEVLFLGTGAYGAAASLRFPEHPGIRVRQLTFCHGGLLQKFHYAFYCLWVMVWVMIFQPRWIYASDPLICPVVFLVSFIPGLQTIYHEHDSPKEEQVTSWMHFVLWARKKLAKRAKLCILPNEDRARRFRMDTGRNQGVFCVWNCPSLEEIAPLRSPFQGKELGILYHGSIVPSRIPLTAVRALANLPDSVRLFIVGYETSGEKSYLRQLQDEAIRLGFVHRVEILGVLPARKDLLKRCLSCDIGVALLPRNSPDFNERTMAGASNKPFDYLACGLALLVPDLPDWVETYVKPGYGLACDPNDSKSVARALLWFLEHPAQMREMGEQGRQKILEDWNYERQFHSALALLEGEPGP